MEISSELLTTAISFFITVIILSYLIGDNPLFRAAIYVFVGVSAGYVASVACYQVLWPSLIQPMFTGSTPLIVQAIPLLLSLLLLMKVIPKLSNLGRPAMAYIVGVGAAVAVGGAVLGTIVPQVDASINGFDISLAVARDISPLLMIVNSGLILLGVVGTLAYFHFGARKKDDGSVKRNILIELLAWVGRVYIAITFGVLFAGVYLAALTALIERIASLTSINHFIATMFG